MKGREAVRAANRRTNGANAAAEQLRAELAAAQADHKWEADGLRAEIKQMKANHMAEASCLAAEEVQRRLAQIEEQRRARGLSDDVARNMLYLKDKFVLNACKYISMTTGEKPLTALSMVMTWMTDEDFYGFEKPEMIVKLGLPMDGWVAVFLRHYKHDLKRVARNRRKHGNAAAVTLEKAEREDHPDIHPDYNPRWYPVVDYSEMELVDDRPVDGGTVKGSAA